MIFYLLQRINFEIRLAIAGGMVFLNSINIRCTLDSDSLKTLIFCLILTRLEYCCFILKISMNLHCIE